MMLLHSVSGCRGIPISRSNLPTEAQWEKAARGTDRRRYPWGNENPDVRKAVYNRNLNGTAPVGSCLDGISPYDVLDMAGNVWEWVADWYIEVYNHKSLVKNPTGPTNGSARVLRGGSWVNFTNSLRTSKRYWFYPNSSNNNLGFRCALITPES